MPNKYVIIGGVAGGATAAARLRRLDEQASITVIERGSYVSYANCGLPYFISGDIEKRSKLLLQSPEGFWGRYRVTVLVETEATGIDRAAKTVQLRGPAGESSLPYDKLILAQGGQPLIPEIPGRDLPHVFKLWTVPDMDAIHRFVKERTAESGAQAPQVQAVIAGGGFIGLEMAEALHQRGLKVTVVEKADQILVTMDREFAAAGAEVLEHHGISIRTGQAITAIEQSAVVLSDGSRLPADLVLLSIGVRPETKLAKAAGFSIGASGGLLVDDYLRTSDPHIYAAGDMNEIVHKVSGKKARIPLAGPANRQGRIAANNACVAQGAAAAVDTKPMKYNGALGSAVVKLMDFTAASCGLTERAALEAGINAASAIVHKDHHASYFPGSKELSVKLVYDRSDNRILGAQAFGQEGVEKRIDVVAMAMQMNATLDDLAEVDLAYAPPYSSANDPLNMAAFVGLNAQSGYSPSLGAEPVLKAFRPGQDVYLDVRTLGEYGRGHVAGALHLPVDDIRDNLESLKETIAGQCAGDGTVYVYCRVGFRGHLATRMLMQAGVNNVINIQGGYTSMLRMGLQAEV